MLLAAPFALTAGDNDRHDPQQGGEARGTRSAPDTPTELSGLSQDPEPAHTRARPEERVSSAPANRPAAATGENGRARESASVANNSKPHGVRSSSAPQNTGKPTGGSKGPSHSPTPTPAWTTTVVTREGQLVAGQSWRTNRITMTMQSDGDLVLYDEHGRARWAAGTKGVGRRVIMQGDGNLVIYDRRDRPVWTSGTAGHENAILCLQADGNVTILHQDRDLWSTNTHDR
ncbi:hypothetical protein ACFWBV_04380 [Streptomyces sp. NPDC060030]|uniref:hypothetical protein n=1 Tax=Streptomyces sp. NPDC060030 TaxID=3347042 RepID=UPI0036B58966